MSQIINEQPQCRIQIFPLQRLQNIMQLEERLLLLTVKVYIGLLHKTHAMISKAYPGE